MKKMKKMRILLISLLIVSNTIMNAQVKISDSGSTTPNSNAIFELESTTKGFLPPRVAINDLTLVAPLTGTVPAGMLVYSSGGAVTDGYYLWDGTKWKPFNTGVGGVDVVAKTADATLTKSETFVVASNSITLTLPVVTAADNGLAITIKNIGSHTDLISIVGNGLATIDGTASAKLFRWKARTFIAYNGNWLRKEKDTGTDFVYEVGASGSWTTIQEILDFLGLHMSGPSLVKLDGGTYEIDATQVVDLAFPVTIEGPSYGQAYIVPVSGITQGTPLFSCVSEVSFKMIAFDATNLAGYGTHAGENALNLVTNAQYHEIKDCTFDRFYSAINATKNVDVWLFESDISNAQYSGVELAVTGPGSKAISFFTSESSFTTCAKGINLTSADSSTISIQNCTFECLAGQTGLFYNPTNFLRTVSMFFTNNTWNNIGTFTSGFDFTRSDGRDANIDIENNAGIENKNPKCKINVVNNATTVTCSNTSTWYKPAWTNTTFYTVNWGISASAGLGNKFTFLPTNTRDIFVILSGNVSVNGNNRTINVAICKNGVTTPASARYGETTLRTVTSGQAYQYSTTIYIPNVAKNDYFEVWVNDATSAGDNVTFQDVNIFVNAQ
jgi:hypothetical protein